MDESKTWEEDLSLGIWAEGESIKDIYQNKKEDDIIEYVSGQNDNLYDYVLRINNIEASYEIKCDLYCSPSYDSGNLYIEFICKGKESGIAVTKADWYINYFPLLNQFWYIKTDILRELITNNNFEIRTSKRDTATPSKGYLINREEFKQYFDVTYPDTNKPPYQSYESYCKSSN